MIELLILAIEDLESLDHLYVFQICIENSLLTAMMYVSSKIEKDLISPLS
jgi:Golgi CORVET complex core vacuolar protein 8